MWRVYRRNRKDEDYANYKDALNVAKTEIRTYKRTFEKKFMKMKFGPLENNRGNIISDGFQMAEVLNEYFSSVFTTEDISSFPVPFTKFEGNKSEHLGQLFVTPEIIAKKIKKVKDNK